MARMWEAKPLRQPGVTIFNHGGAGAEGNRPRIARARGVNREISGFSSHLRFTLTRHFAGRGLSRRPKPGMVPPLYWEVFRCWTDAKARATRLFMAASPRSASAARKGRSFLARIIWWRDNFVGVAFSSETQLPVSDLAERLRKSEKKKKQLQRRINELLGEG
jgi:hypothetical protein